MAAKGGKGCSKGAKSATIAQNRRARHDYEVIDTFEAGIALVGPEVKSLRAGKANLSDAYAVVIHGDMVLKNLHISPYAHAARENPDPRRDTHVYAENDKPATWQYDLPNGMYRIDLVAGSADWTGIHHVSIEGTKVIDGVYTGSGQFVEVNDHDVVISDGKLFLREQDMLYCYDVAASEAAEGEAEAPPGS